MRRVLIGYTSIDSYPTSIVFFSFFYQLEKKLRLNNNLPFANFSIKYQGALIIFMKNRKGRIMAEVKFHLEGIVCTGCATDMENILLDLDGVEEASVNFKDGIFSITYDPAEADVKSITKKVKNLGFKTKILGS